MSDTITVLRSHGRRLAKVIHADGKIDCYDSAKTFDVAEVAVGDLDHLGRILTQLAGRPDLCIVRGEPIEKGGATGVRRLVYPDEKTGTPPTLRDCSHSWIGLDIDGVVRPDDVDAADLVACASLAIALLPPEFRSARAIIQATSGHGLKPGSRLRAWYWSDRPLTSAELTRWCRSSPVDGALFRPAQVIYTASPLFADGRTDHLPTRMVIIPGQPRVTPPSVEALAPPQRQAIPPRLVRFEANRAERLVTGVLLGLETAVPGQRHDRLRAAARTIGGVMDELGISASDAQTYLLAAARHAAGPEFSEAAKIKTIVWGLERGRSEPLNLGGRYGRS